MHTQVHMHGQTHRNVRTNTSLDVWGIPSLSFSSRTTPCVFKALSSKIEGQLWPMVLMFPTSPWEGERDKIMITYNNSIKRGNTWLCVWTFGYWILPSSFISLHLYFHYLLHQFMMGSHIHYQHSWTWHWKTKLSCLTENLYKQLFMWQYANISVSNYSTSAHMNYIAIALVLRDSFPQILTSWYLFVFPLLWWIYWSWEFFLQCCILGGYKILLCIVL